MKKILKYMLVASVITLFLSSAVFAADLEDPYIRACIKQPNITLVK